MCVCACACGANRLWNVSLSRGTRCTPRDTKLPKYRISIAQMSPELADEFHAFRRFLTVRRLGSSAAPIKDVTAAKYDDMIRGLLGWMHHELKAGVIRQPDHSPPR